MMLGDNIRKYRELSGYSQSELAGLLGIKKQTLYKYEHNIVKNIPLDCIEQIGLVLDIDPAVLTGWNRSPEDRYKLFSEKLAQLDEEDRARIAERIDMLLEQDKYNET